MPDYKDIRFLESTTNLREILSRNSGRELSLERANQIAACLEQGRLLFESAQNVGWEIKPLLVYYGMVGFSKAIILARNFSKLESLPPRHGLVDLSDSPRIEKLKVRFERDGTFQGLNDSCSSLEKLIYHDTQGVKQRISRPTCEAKLLEGKEITLKEILGRIPDLEDLYRKTFGEEPLVLSISHFSATRGYSDSIEFTVGSSPLFTKMNNLSDFVNQLSSRFAFLENWCVSYAKPNLGVTFANLDREGKPEIPPYDPHVNAHYFQLQRSIWIGSTPREARHSPPYTFNLAGLAANCQPVRGNLTRTVESTCLIEQWNGLFLSELSLYLLGMFLLSCLVRYRPHIWANSIARRSFPEKPLDDYALVLIEEFIDLSFTVFPQATVIAINEPFCD